MSGAGGTRGREGCGGAGAPSGPRARSASPMRIRICFFPKIREKSADTVRPMVGPGAGVRAGTRGEGWNRPAAGGWGATAEGGGAAAAASARPGPPDVTWPRPSGPASAPPPGAFAEELKSSEAWQPCQGLRDREGDFSGSPKTAGFCFILQS